MDDDTRPDKSKQRRRKPYPYKEARRVAWIRLKVADLRDSATIARMTGDERRIYLDILHALWTQGGELPAEPDQIARLLDLDREQLLEAWPSMADQFCRDPKTGRLYHPTVDDELADSVGRLGRRKRAAETAAASRWAEPEDASKGRQTDTSKGRQSDVDPGLKGRHRGRLSPKNDPPQDADNEGLNANRIGNRNAIAHALDDATLDMRHKTEVPKKEPETPLTPLRVTLGEYNRVRITERDLAKLHEDFGAELIAQLVEELDAWIEEAPAVKSSGVRRDRRNPYLTLRAWARRRLEQTRAPGQRRQTASAADNLRVAMAAIGAEEGDDQ